MTVTLPCNAGLVTIWNENQRPYITMSPSVFERLAPKSIEVVERTAAPVKARRGNTIPDITLEILDALEAAYRETGEI